MNDIIIKPIGYIKSPFKKVEDIPPQSIYANEKTAVIELLEEYKEGFKDLENFSYIVVQFYFHQSKGYDLHTLTPWSEERKGVFSTRSPRRPNPIGISIVKLKKIDGCKIEIQGVDMLDKTPIVDIKPYIAKLNPVKE